MIALGCQTTKSFWPASPASAKNAVQSMPGAAVSNLARVQGLLALLTSSESSRFQCASAIRRSRSKIRWPRAPASAMPASFSTAAMWAW